MQGQVRRFGARSQKPVEDRHSFSGPPRNQKVEVAKSREENFYLHLLSGGFKFRISFLFFSSRGKWFIMMNNFLEKLQQHLILFLISFGVLWFHCNLIDFELFLDDETSKVDQTVGGTNFRELHVLFSEIRSSNG